MHKIILCALLAPALFGCAHGASPASLASVSTSAPAATIWRSYCAGSRHVDNIVALPLSHGNQIERVFVAVAYLPDPTPVGWKYVSFSGHEYMQPNFIVKRDGNVTKAGGTIPAAAIGGVLDEPARYYKAIMRSWLAPGELKPSVKPSVKPYSELSAATNFQFVECR